MGKVNKQSLESNDDMNVTILAVTKRYDGICIAGVDNNLRWVRPAKNRTLTLEDIKLNGEYLSISSVYDFSFIKHNPHNYQTENYIMDETKKILYTKTLTEQERKNLFPKLSENSLIISNPERDISAVLKKEKRSLILLGPVEIESLYIYSENSKMKTPRIICNLNSFQIKNQRGKHDLPCTDLKFRAFAKHLLKEKNTDSLSLHGDELKKLLKFNQVFIAIGLTEKFREDYWPMIIGFHTIPDYKQEVDYNDL